MILLRFEFGENLSRSFQVIECRLSASIEIFNCPEDDTCHQNNVCRWFTLRDGSDSHVVVIEERLVVRLGEVA